MSIVNLLSWLSQEIVPPPDSTRRLQCTSDRRICSRRLSRSASMEAASGTVGAEDFIFSNRFCDLLKGRDSARTTIIRDIDITMDSIRLSYNQSDLAHLIAIIDGMRSATMDSVMSEQRHRQLSIVSKSSDTLRYVHSGQLTQRCGDWNSFSVVSKILKRY